MEKHIKTYLEFFNRDQNELICEICWDRAVDVHHIVPRSKFGKKTKNLQDLIENLIGLCRNCHEKAHFIQTPYLSKEELQLFHNRKIWR